MRTIVDICGLLGLLLAGLALRTWIGWLRKLYLPAAVVGGFLGLCIGPYGANILPQHTLAFWQALPSFLISFVFASLFLQMSPPSKRDLLTGSGRLLLFGLLVGVGQYAVGCLVTALVLTPIFNVPDAFASLLEVGFAGGHGTAAAMTEVYAKMGFEAGGALAQMSATVGIIVGVVGGIMLIKLATARGRCSQLPGTTDLLADLTVASDVGSTKHDHHSITLSSDVIDPMTLHLAISGLAVLIGWLILQGINILLPSLPTLPLFPLAMVGGMITNVFIRRIEAHVGEGNWVNAEMFSRVSGVALDLLVVSAIASLRLDLFVSNIYPFLILMTAGIAWMILSVLWIAPRMLRDDVFEQAIAEYGMQTGVTAVGLLLLRIVDPGQRTSALSRFSTKQFFYCLALGGGWITMFAPRIICRFGSLYCGIGCCLIICTIGAFSRIVPID